MTKVRAKRKRPRKWLLVWYRAVGEFKNGERRMMSVDRFHKNRYPNQKLAWRRQSMYATDPHVGFVCREGNQPKKIVEIQVFYPEE